MNYIRNYISKSVSVICTALVASAAYAQTGPVSKVNTDLLPNARAGTEYWTAERFKAAKPLALPQAMSGAQIYGDATSAAQPVSRAASSNGQAPSQEFIFPGQQLYTPAPAELSMQSDSPTTPQDTGTFNAPFTSSRVFPLFSGASVGFSADRAYPYTTVGKLFFSINGAPYVCSASVIQRRVVATAGHCVHSGTASGF